MSYNVNHGRRDLLRGIGGVSLGLAASGNALAADSDDVTTQGVDRDVDLGNIVKHPNDSISDNITARHTAGAEVMDAVGSGTHWHLPLRVSSNTRAHTYGDKSDKRFRIDVTGMEVNSPKPLNTQFDEYHLGAYKYKEPIDGTATTTHAESTLSLVMTLISASLSWGLSASVMASAFVAVASSALENDIDREWVWDNYGEYTRPTPEQSTWLKFEVDSVAEGESVDVSIQTQSDMNTFDYNQLFSTRTDDTLDLQAPSYSPSDVLSLRTEQQKQTNARVQKAKNLPADVAAPLDVGPEEEVVRAPVKVRNRS